MVKQIDALNNENNTHIDLDADLDQEVKDTEKDLKSVLTDKSKNLQFKKLLEKSLIDQVMNSQYNDSRESENSKKDKNDYSDILTYKEDDSKFVSRRLVKEQQKLKTENKLKIFQNRLNRALYGVRPSVKILSGKL